MEKQAEENENDDSSKENNPFIWTTYAAAVCVYLFLVFYSIGPGVIPGVLGSEMFTQGPRTAALCFSLACCYVASFSISVLFPLVTVNIHFSLRPRRSITSRQLSKCVLLFLLQSAVGGYTFLVFAALQLFYAVFTYFKIPETKGKETEEVAKDLKKEWEKNKKK